MIPDVSGTDVACNVLTFNVPAEQLYSIHCYSF